MPGEEKQQLLAIGLAFLGRLQNLILNQNIETLLLEEEIQTDAFKASIFFLNKFSRDVILTKCEFCYDSGFWQFQKISSLLSQTL